MAENLNIPPPPPAAAAAAVQQQQRQLFNSSNSSRIRPTGAAAVATCTEALAACTAAGCSGSRVATEVNGTCIGCNSMRQPITAACLLAPGRFTRLSISKKFDIRLCRLLHVSVLCAAAQECPHVPLLLPLYCPVGSTLSCWYVVDHQQICTALVNIFQILLFRVLLA
jgi:hypothetical protein